jgi:hypothetical protein
MMDNEIESIDRKRRSFLRGYLVAFAVFVILMIIRFFFRAADLNREPVGIAVLVGLVIAVAVQAIYMMGLAFLQRRIRKDPSLREALDNELVRLCELRSWKTAFFASIGTAFFFALVAFFYPICDLMLVALMATVVGAGAYRAAFYFIYRD